MESHGRIIYDFAEKRIIMSMMDLLAVGGRIVANGWVQRYGMLSGLGMVKSCGLCRNIELVCGNR